jgi:hypothetical protein
MCAIAVVLRMKLASLINELLSLVSPAIPVELKRCVYSHDKQVYSLNGIPADTKLRCPLSLQAAVS